MRKLRFTLLIATLIAAVGAAPLLAGVVFEVETKDHRSQEVTTSQAAVEGRLLKMEVKAGGGGGDGEMIYRGDRREMVVVDHGEKSYFVLDAEGIKQIAGQIGAAMSQMEEALKNVPESQRAAIEKMMKDRMPQQVTAAVQTELKKTGEHAEQAGYPCVKYDVLQGGEKVREMWVTDWSNVEGGKEVAGMFREMSGFFQEMMDAFRSASGPMGALVSQIGDNMFEHMKELDGFPVVTREFGGGGLESESTLRSAARKSFAAGDFEPPAGYKQQQMFGR